jgi:hypothetical protein
MTTMKLRDDLPISHPANVLRELLHQPGSNAVDRQVPSIEDRAVATLERRAPDVVRTARTAGIEIEFLGVSRLFRDPRFYEGQDADWILAPSDPRNRAVAPRREGRELERLAALGLDLPLLYEAHEVDQAETGELRQAAAEGRRELTVAQASGLVGPVPPPPDSVALAERLAHRSTQVAHAARRTVQVAGAAAVAVVTVPAAAVGTALASAATLDPIIIGAMPAYSERPGAPAGWYALARWDW